MWFSTVNPFIRVSVFVSKLTKRLSSRTFVVKNFSNSLTYTVASSCVCTSPLAGYDCCRTARFRQSMHFSFTQVLFSDHVHRHSGVCNKFSFLKFKSWCRQAPIFWRWEECCSLMLLQFQHIFGQPPRCFTGPSLLPFRLFLRPILKFWSIGATLMRFTWTNVTERRILVSNGSMTYHGFRDLNTSDWFSVCLISSVKSMKTSAVPSPGIRNPIVVLFSTQPLHFCHHSFETFLLGCSSTWRCAWELCSPNLHPFSNL